MRRVMRQSVENKKFKARKGRANMKRGVWFGLLLMSIGTVGLARTYHVGTDGNDENPGSEVRPLRTIQEAADTVRAGDTILVRGGVYREAVVLRFSGQKGKPITLRNIFCPPGDNLAATEENAFEAIDNRQIDPTFVDVTAFDFHLKAGSPAVDTGAGDRAARLDFEGRSRPQGDKVDIGAHEFSPTGEPLRLHPYNPHYFQFRGEPAVLITSGEHYGAVINLDFDYVVYLDELARYDFNHTRLFAGTYREIPGSFGIAGNTVAPAPKRYAAPWARSDTPGYFDGGNKFDLTRWDEVYFKRLKNFVGQAAKRGIVVEVTLFCTMYSEELWKASPMHTSNNINGIGRVGRYEVYGLKEDALTKAQAAVTRKIVRELNPFDNVYYEICNEPYERGGMHADWQGRMIAAIRDTEMSLANRHLISLNFAHGSAKVAAPHPDVSIYNFHAAKPEAVTLNYGLRRAIGHNETGGSRRDDVVYRIQGWEFILAGGALFSHLDFSFATNHPRGTLLDHRGPGGGGPALRWQLGILKEFINSFEFVTMKPDNSVIKGGVPAKGRSWALAEPGRAYAIYLVGRGPTQLILELPEGEFRSEWIDPVDGSIDARDDFTHGGGPRQLQSPDFDQDIALSIKAQ